MKWFQETTEWATPTPNGIYLLDDSKSKMYAYRPSGKSPIKTFRAPIKIDVRGRKFKLNPTQYRTDAAEEQPEGRVWQVKGSKGDVYKVSELNGEYSCTCSGFRFRGACKHSESIRSTV